MGALRFAHAGTKRHTSDKCSAFPPWPHTHFREHMSIHTTLTVNPPSFSSHGTRWQRVFRGAQRSQEFIMSAQILQKEYTMEAAGPKNASQLTNLRFSPAMTQQEGPNPLVISQILVILSFYLVSPITPVPSHMLRQKLRGEVRRVRSIEEAKRVPQPWITFAKWRGSSNLFTRREVEEGPGVLLYQCISPIRD